MTPTFHPTRARVALVFSIGAFALLAALASAPIARAAGGPTARSSEADARLEAVLTELATARAEIARAKVPLSKSLSKIEDEVARLRRDRERLVKVQDASTIDLGSLRKQVGSLGEQQDFIKSRLVEFVRDFEGRLNISELPRYEELTSRAKLSEKNVNLDTEARRETQIAVAHAALDRIRDQLGGLVFEGEALAPTGVLKEGRFLAFGPTVFYVSDDGSVSGLVESRLNAADPVVVPLPDADGASLAALATTGQGELPFDATLGRALKIEKARKSLDQYVADGGPVGAVIIGLGLAALMLTAFKAFEIVRFPVAPPEVVDEVLEELAQGSQAAAAKRSMQLPGVAGEMLETGVRHATQSREILEELLYEKILRVRPTLERFLPFLSITAAAAPLLGLLGTVIGMINTFQLITIFGTGDAKSLSSGISEALMTTAFGLIVAIPVLILHGALSRMAKRKLGLLEELSVAFVNGVDVIRNRVSPNP